MSLPLLPFDVISEIIDHLRNESTAEQVFDGQSISLVCKAWQPLGQALRWRRIEIDRRRLSSLLKHFDLHPKLGRLVHECRLRQTLASRNTAHAEEEEDDRLIYAQLPDLLSKLVNLESFAVEDSLGGSFGPTVRILSELSNLDKAEFCVAKRPEWWSELVSSWNSGFKKLSNLSFIAPGAVVLELPVDDIQPSGNIIALKTLLVGWHAVPASNSRIAERFLSRLDPNTLQVANLLGTATCRTSFQWLLECPNLVNLSISLSLHQVLHDFPDHLSMLPQFPSLELLKVGVSTGDIVIPSPVPLAAILASFPPSLRMFDCPQFVFSDFDALPRRELPNIPSEATRHLAALCPDPDGGRGLNEERVAVDVIVWGEETEGVITWSYDVEPTEDTSSQGTI